jgi:hypothetical protein
MKRVDYLQGDNYPDGVCAIIKGRKISFALFQKAIKVNSDLRRQIKDIIDLGLCEYAFRVNEEIIQAAKERAEAQSTEIMMKFLNGMGNYQLLKRLVHRNRVIRILAMKDCMEQNEMLSRVKQLKVV